MDFLLLVLSILMAGNGYALHPSITTGTIYPKTPVKKADDALSVQAAVQQAVQRDISLQLVTQQESPPAFHYTFQQYYQQLPILETEVRATVSKRTASLVSIHVVLAATEGWPTTIKPSVDGETAREKVMALYPAAIIEMHQRALQVDEHGQPEAVWAFHLKANAHRYEVVVGKELQVRNMDAFAQDSTVSGYVFNPDPLTTAHVSYGGSYIDDFDNDRPELNNQRQLKSFKADFNAGLFSLRNSYVMLQDLNSDGILPVTSTTPQFQFTRHQLGFEDVNVFYHLNQQRSHIHQLGFTSADVQVIADPHGLDTCRGACDNSYFSAPNNLLFGRGGVDDGEDADVIVHEYTHFISYNASPNTNAGSERMALDEGTGDYMAAGYSKVLDDYHWTDVYNWDGHNEYWNGRTVYAWLEYPNSVVANIYQTGQIWSSALMDLQNRIGRDACDSLVLQTMYSFASNQTLAEAAQALLEADTLLSNGNHTCQILAAFIPRGLLDFRNNACYVYPRGIATIQEDVFEFHPYQSSFDLTAVRTQQPVTLTLYDLSGQVLLTRLPTGRFDGSALPSGVYLIQAGSANHSQTFKWIKF
ncbi:MAG: M36 family metallopeptidase [Chitinophagales bacterium]